VLEPFRVTIDIRTDDLDLNGHVRGPAYLAYADHARWECVWAAGVDPVVLKAGNLGPVNLETTIRFRRELLARARIDVLTKFAAATVGTSAASRLVADPGRYWRKYATRPEILGLDTDS
jgi:acyl-CoA thioester hydrolase